MLCAYRAWRPDLTLSGGPELEIEDIRDAIDRDALAELCEVDICHDGLRL